MISIEVRSGEGGSDAIAFAEHLTLSIIAYLRSQHLEPTLDGYNVIAVEAPKECV